MITNPGGDRAAAGQKTQTASPGPGTAGAAESPQQARLAVVALPREIDTSNDSRVQDTLTRALADSPAVLVADASGTTFCGCSGVAALIFTHHRAAAAGAQLRVAASPAMRRMLELTGAGQMLHTYPTLAAALADGRAPVRS
jgi:anti-sigma B factor antagonist